MQEQFAEVRDDGEQHEGSDTLWRSCDWSAVTHDAVIAGRSVPYVDVGSVWRPWDLSAAAAPRSVSREVPRTRWRG
jgi:hypothetical protein